MSRQVKDANGNWHTVAGGSSEPFTGATSSTGGTAGYVPAPSSGDQDKVLKGNGSWVPPDAVPTANSENVVKSGGVKTALDGKLATYSGDSSQWDTTPTANSTKPVTSGGLKTAFDSRDTAIAKCECLVLSANSISALPYTFSNAAIETDMVCINSVLSNPSAQLSDWTVNTDTAGQATISGTISGSTNITIYMMKSR